MVGSPVDGYLGGTAKIVGITAVGEGDFYDFTVPHWHNYAMAGIFHHNSGKTVHAAHKTARYVLEHDAPRERTPFWIIGDTYDQVCQVCWNEKLSQIIPQEWIAGFDWYRSRRNWPFAVFLKDRRDPKKIGWVLEFKSYARRVCRP